MNLEDPVELLEEARKGSTQAFSALVRQYQSRVRAYLGRFVRDTETVDDLAQDTFLRAYRSLGNFKGEASLGVWLLGIARNVALMYTREEIRRRTHEKKALRDLLPRWLAEHLEGDAARLDNHDRALTALEECLEKLPTHSASLIEGYYFKGRSASQMAKEMGKKQSAIWMTLLRIREALRRCVQLGTTEGEVGV